MNAPYYTDEHVTIHHGDCIDVLATLADNSVDSVVSDPPYGLEFMGKEWDRPDRMGKVSGLGVADGTPFRRNGGTPAWGASGNPTCRNCGGDKYRKGPRKCTCASPSFPNDMARQMRSFGEWCELWATECLRVLKPGGHLLAFGGTRTWHRLAVAVEDAGFEVRDSIAWLYGSGFPKSRNVGREVPGFDGWGTALKPAFEPIVVARKPLTGTVAANVLTHGTGALNIDGCRVGTDERIQTATGSTPGRTVGPLGLSAPYTPGDGREYRTGGRWPANVVLDDTQAAALDRQSGILHPPGTRSIRVNRTPFANGDAPLEKRAAINDTGGASRFFPTFPVPIEPFQCNGCPDEYDSADDLLRHIRSDHTESFPTFRYQAKAPTAERPKGDDGTAHPTVKPLELMRWLVRLVTPPGGTVLEPFAGSGTTVEAALLEGFRCIAIEREPDYLPLIQQRIDRAQATIAARPAHAQDALDFGEAS